MQSVPRTLLFKIADMLIDVVDFLCAIAIMAFRMCGGARAKCEQVKTSSSQAITTIRSLDASGLCSILRDVLLFLANQLEYVCSCCSSGADPEGTAVACALKIYVELCRGAAPGMHSSPTDLVAAASSGTQATLDITTAKWMTRDPITERWQLDEAAHSPTLEVQSLAGIECLAPDSLTTAPAHCHTSNFTTGGSWLTYCFYPVNSTNLSPSASPQRACSLAPGLNSSPASTLTSPQRPCSPAGPALGLCSLASHAPVPQPERSYKQPKRQIPDNVYVAPHVRQQRAQQALQHSRAQPEAQQVMTAVEFRCCLQGCHSAVSTAYSFTASSAGSCLQVRIEEARHPAPQLQSKPGHQQHQQNRPGCSQQHMPAQEQSPAPQSFVYLE